MEKDLELENNTQKEEEQKKAVVGVKNKKNKHKKRLLLLFLLLLITGVMLSTSTYAWFTSNMNVKVNDITVNVEAKNGIQISTDGTTWKSIIQTADITGATTKYAAAVNQLPSSMEPVSTVGTITDDGKMEMFYGTVNNNETTGKQMLTATKETDVNGTTGKYVAFDLFFKVDSAVSLQMDPGSGVAPQNVGADKGIKSASRIAFVVLGNTTAGDTLANVQALGTSGAASSPVYIWEPNNNTHTAAAVAHARDNYGITTTSDGLAPAIAYNGIKAEIAGDGVELKSTDTNYFSTVSIAYPSKESFDTAFDIFGLQAGITKVRVYMWIEGQDIDCENNASGDQIVYNFSITVKE